jgi:phosphonate transport system substrate-binding protein
MNAGVATALAAVAAAIFASSCGGGDGSEHTLYVAGIPDQNATRLARRYDGLTEYLARQLGVDVQYVPTVDYAATVIAFKQDAIQLGWFGGLTGVMARREVPGSVALAQRPRDRAFRSVFIVQSGLDVDELGELKGLTFTFGSELSTSGHLMPRHFLLMAGVDPDTELRSLPNFSGSHDKTWKLVESGAFQAGALNQAVWEAAITEGRVDTSKVGVIHITPAYYDYNWTIRGDVEKRFGAGFKEWVLQALVSAETERPEILELFSADRFIPTENANYGAIQDVAEALGIIE